MRKLLRLFAAMALVIVTLGTMTAQANHEGDGEDHAFADSAFENRWERLDRPVAEYGVDRTFWWGPGPYTPGLTEEYEQSPGNQRLVQYFDKSRMEINNPNGDPDELWYVTNGLLVVEMIEGKVQIGDGEFRDAEPADVPVAGDPDNPYGPTYATLAQRLDDPALDQNVLIADRINRDGSVTYDPALNDYQIGIGTYVPETGHSVAAPFWEIMNSNGTIWVDGELTNGPIFQNPFYAVGYPITEPYWSTAVVADVEQDVLLQCFERRCLTYTPGNEVGFQVEAGNVGQHYYRWRYGNDNGQNPDTETANIFFVSIGDAGQNGQLIGCDDSLIPVDIEIAATDDTATRVDRVLSALLNVDDQTYEDTDLYNSLYQSDLTVQSVTMDGAEANVDIVGEMAIGGVCDEPRFEEQILQTVLNVEGVSSAMITVNGTPLDQLFGGPDNGDEMETVQIYLIAQGDDGENGQVVGCGDSLIPVDVQIEATDDTATRVERALMELFGIDEEFYGESGLYNSLYQSNLSVASVTMNGSEAVVEISGTVQVGGTCDEPRFEEQITQTVLQLEGVDFATITINGTPLEEYFSGPGNGNGDQTEDTANVVFVELNASSGEIFGCGDATETVEVAIEPTDDRATQIERALEALFAVNDETYQDTDLYNALYQSDLTVDSVALTGNVAYVSLSGDVQIAGACDEPRFDRQIRQTILALPSIDEANVMLNGQPLDEYFSQPEDETETVNIYFVALEDNGQNGKLIGCGDSLIPVEVEIAATDSPGARVLEALNALVETEEQTVTGPDGRQLYNALAESDVAAMAAEVESGLATVHMAGEPTVSGTCDEPRFVEQIRQTVLQFDAVHMTNVFLDGELLRGYFSPESMNEGVLATFSVSGELFNLWSTNQDTIDQIMALEAGTSNASIPNGPILRGSGTANHNAPWSWHLDPEMTAMAEVTIEVCDAAPSFVEDNVDYFVDDVGQYCPWSAELIHVEDLTPDESS